MVPTRFRWRIVPSCSDLCEMSGCFAPKVRMKRSKSVRTPEEIRGYRVERSSVSAGGRFYASQAAKPLQLDTTSWISQT